MKLKRLKDEYITVRKELYNRMEENNTLQHELVECRFKNDYNLHITSQTFNTLRSVCSFILLFHYIFLFKISQLIMKHQLLFNFI